VRRVLRQARERENDEIPSGPEEWTAREVLGGETGIIMLLTCNMTIEDQLLRRTRLILSLFMIGLIVSGLTAFPLMAEVSALARLLPDAGSANPSAFTTWILKVQAALAHVHRDYPFLPYGTDWLAFAHLVIAVAFIGPWRDPVRNIWVIDFGLIACAAVVPLALIAGQFRGIPWWWRLIDCSFGVFGAIPLFVVRRMIMRMERVAE